MADQDIEDGGSEIYETFKMDDDDIKILSLFQQQPDITHVKNAKKIHKSQPAVGARVTKLQRKDILATQKGVNFKKMKEKLYLLLVDLQTRDPTNILEGEITHCPFVINAFKKSGIKNVTVLLAATRMDKLENIIDRHFRANPDIISVETSFIVDMVDELILPVNWEFLKYEHIPCGEICCRSVKERMNELDLLEN